MPRVKRKLIPYAGYDPQERHSRFGRFGTRGRGQGQVAPHPGLQERSQMSRAEQIADALIGTPQSLLSVASYEEAENDGLMSELYTLAFECDRCGWWCSTDELNNETGEEFCDDCQSDTEGGDEE